LLLLLPLLLLPPLLLLVLLLLPLLMLPMLLLPRLWPPRLSLLQRGRHRSDANRLTPGRIDAGAASPPS